VVFDLGEICQQCEYLIANFHSIVLTEGYIRTTICVYLICGPLRFVPMSKLRNNSRCASMELYSIAGEDNNLI
jgi:hypothetical protein